ncbi:unnamed protein product [Rhizophagus irregularis]|nr:unnamed protein product [Rhizophagus irregularis]
MWMMLTIKNVSEKDERVLLLCAWYKSQLLNEEQLLEIVKTVTSPALTKTVLFWKEKYRQILAVTEKETHIFNEIDGIPAGDKIDQETKYPPFVSALYKTQTLMFYYHEAKFNKTSEKSDSYDNYKGEFTNSTNGSIIGANSVIRQV